MGEKLIIIILKITSDLKVRILDLKTTAFHTSLRLLIYQILSVISSDVLNTLDIIL